MSSLFLAHKIRRPASSRTESSHVVVTSAVALTDERGHNARHKPLGAKLWWPFARASTTMANRIFAVRLFAATRRRTTKTREAIQSSQSRQTERSVIIAHVYVPDSHRRRRRLSFLEPKLLRNSFIGRPILGPLISMSQTRAAHRLRSLPGFLFFSLLLLVFQLTASLWPPPPLGSQSSIRPFRIMNSRLTASSQIVYNRSNLAPL